jgi:long-chain acyl-CoA synthetase
MNISDHLERSARLFADRPALIFEGECLRYADLNREVCAFAVRLRHLGVGLGDRVGLFLTNTPAYVISYFAILRLGAIAVSFNARSTASELAILLLDADPSLLISHAALLEALEDAPLPAVPCLLVADGWPRAQQEKEFLLDEPPANLEPQAPAAILYSSGTTGKPKGVLLSHVNVVSNAWAFVNHCGIRASDRLLVVLPLFHCFAQNALVNSAVLAGAALVMQRRFQVDTALDAISGEAISMLFAVPTMFHALLEKATREHMATVRYYFSAAAILPPAVEQRWTELLGAPIHQGYGLTETSPFASYNHPFVQRPGSIGMPIENVEMMIVDVHSCESLQAGEVGEIVIRGPNVMLGYWNNPEATAEVIRNGWFHSGDLGIVDEDGYFTIVDRVKDMINVGGMNVYPVEVENCMLQHPSIAEVAVYGVVEPLLGEQVEAAVVLNPSAPNEAETLQAFCRERLADFKVPLRIHVVTALPRNPTGKILKRVLRDQAEELRRRAGLAALQQMLAAAALLERQALIETWLRERLAAVLALEVEQIEPQEPLADAGLESLQAVEIVALLLDGLGLQTTAVTLLNGSLRSVSHSLAEGMNASAASTVPDQAIATTLSEPPC